MQKTHNYQALLKRHSGQSPHLDIAVGTHKGTVPLEDSWALSCRVKHTHHMTQQSFPDYLPKNKENTCPQKGQYATVNYILFCDSLIHDGTKLGRTQRYWLIYWWTDKQIEAYLYNGILIGGKGKPTMDPHNMDRSQKLSFCYEKEARHKGLHAVSYNPLLWNSRKGKTYSDRGQSSAGQQLYVGKGAGGKGPQGNALGW